MLLVTTFRLSAVGHRAAQTVLGHNTQASDFSCLHCHFWFQLKGQKTRIGSSITDGAYTAMMAALQRNEAPSYYFMHYEIVPVVSSRGARPSPGAVRRVPASNLPIRDDFPHVALLPDASEGGRWIVRDLLLVPHFAFPPSAIIRRKPLSANARRAGWIGCNFALDRIPPDARIEIISTRSSGRQSAHSKLNQSRLASAATIIIPPEEVREKFRRIKPLKELSLKERGWTLDVLNVVRRLNLRSSGRSPALTFTNSDIYAHERELAQLHPDNRHVRDKIRQQLQVLRDAGLLVQVQAGSWMMS